MGIAFVRGIQENGAIATGKHFPGHGDTETDSHIALPVIRHDRARMDSVELRPFNTELLPQPVELRMNRRRNVDRGWEAHRNPP